MSKKEEIQNQMMDYLYDEMDPVQRKEFEKILESRPELQTELNELREMSGLLSSTPSAVPEYKPAFLTISKEFEKQAPQRRQLRKGYVDQEGSEEQGKGKSLFTPFMKTLMAIAASLLLVLFGSSLAGMEMGQTENGFYLTVGNPPTETESGISEEQVLELIEQIQGEQTLLLTTLMQEAQRKQNEQFNEMVTLLADYYDDQRQQDLILIAEGLDQLETQTQYRFNRTNEALGDLIYAISNP